jgi:hypothetical protein
MENGKQTAVEWLEEQFIWMIEDGVDWFDAFHSVMSKLEQAKQMEKEQMIKFAMHLHDVDISKTGTDILMEEAEQYYNETYGK